MDNKIIKSARVTSQETSAEEMALINKHSIKELTADDVFTFKVAMCDNEIDRDFEVFPVASLKGLAELFAGKTVISDHRWSAANQVARIYSTEIEPGSGASKTGEAYSQLVAHCYMVRTETNKDLITEIESGIKKEVSVGCAIESAICSICGADNRKTWCDHWWGKEYDGKLCHFSLEKPTDAYELSFVAVPAQPRAGVKKAYGAERPEKPPEQPLSDLTKQATELIAQRIRAGGSFIFAQKERKNEK